MTKRVYIWESVNPVSSAWHSDGGLVVVCEDGAFEETIRKHYGDILTDPEISSLESPWLDQNSMVPVAGPSAAVVGKVSVVPLVVAIRCSPLSAAGVAPAISTTQ